MNPIALLEAAFEAGLSGPGRLHDLIVNVYAVTPGELKERGAGLTIRYGVHEGPFGPFFLAVTEKGVCALTFLDGETRREGDGGAAEGVEAGRPRGGPAGHESGGGPDLRPAERKAPGAPLSAVVKGTNFQVRVWEALVRIPPGCVVSYEDVASRVGAPARRARGRERAGAEPRGVPHPLPPGDPEDGRVREVRRGRSPEEG